jgi:hypothetical protein
VFFVHNYIEGQLPNNSRDVNHKTYNKTNVEVLTAVGYEELYSRIKGHIVHRYPPNISVTKGSSFVGYTAKQGKGNWRTEIVHLSIIGQDVRFS